MHAAYNIFYRRPPLHQTRGLTPEAQRLFSNSHYILWGLIFLGSIIAFSIIKLYPGETESQYQTAITYAKQAWRNSTLFFSIVLSIFLAKLVLETRDQSIFKVAKSYIDENQAVITRSTIRTIFGIVAFAIFMWSFSAIKTRIPIFIPFYADSFLIKLDRFLFFGADAWTYAKPLYQSEHFVMLLDAIYDIWAGLLVGAWLTAFTFGKRVAKGGVQLCIAIILIWFFGGGVAATVLSSVGPCFYMALTGDTSFAPQMALLMEIGDLRAIEYQNLLWQQYKDGVLGQGGISAMPSMHCATAFLFILAFRHHGKYWHFAMVIYFLLILFSSVFLAWHYAADGLLAIPLAYIGWHLAGFLSRVQLPPYGVASQKTDG